MHRNPTPGRPRRAARWRRLLLLSGGIGLLAGCDAREPTAPATPGPTAPPSTRRTDLGQPLGYTFLTLPGNSSPSAIESIQAQDAGPVPDSVWVIINVTGEIVQAWNPDCGSTPPYWPCQTGPVAYPFSDLPSTGGPVNVWVQQGTSGGWTSLRGVGGSNGNNAVGLHYQTRAGGIGAKLNLMPKWAWNPNTGHGPYSYSLSGGYDVNVTQITSPIEIDDQGVIDGAGTHRYTLRTTYDLQLINPRDWSWSWPAGAVHWYFFPGASVSEKPGYGGPHYELTACRFLTTCNFAPPGPGRVQADAYVETRNAMVRTRDASQCPSDGVGGEPGLEQPNMGLDVITPTNCVVVEEPTLQVTCSSGVTRGQPGTCTASAGSNVTLSNFRWRFDPDLVTIHPKAGPVKMADSVSEVTPGATWAGPLVLSGKVTIRATLNGNTDSASTRVTVSARTWNTGPGPNPPRVDLGYGQPPLQNGVPIRFGENVHVESDGTLHEGVALLGFKLADPAPVAPGRILTVPSGPNRGYAYVEQHDIRLNRAYRLNRYITEGNTHQDIDIGGGVMKNRWHALLAIGGGTPNDFLQRTIQHETYGTGGRVGHQDGLVSAVTGEVCGNVARRIERIAGSPLDVNDQLSEASFAAGEFHSVGAGHHRVHSHMQGGAPLVVRAPPPGSAAPVVWSGFNDGQGPLQTISYRHICEYEGWGL